MPYGRRAVRVSDTSAHKPSAVHTVLLVDHLETNRSVRARALRAAGFSVIDAANGADALQLAAMERPSLVLLNEQLPDIDGFEVCRQLKSDPNTGSIPVIQISAPGRHEDDVSQALENGTDLCLREPVDSRTIIAAARRLIRASEAEQRQREAEQRLHEAEERARESESRASQALESIADPVVSFDKEWR